MKFLFCSALIVFFSGACMADDLSITGAVALGSNYVDIGQSLTGGPYPPAPGTGIFQVTGVGASSIFANAGVTAGEQGSLESNNGTYPASSFLTITGNTGTKGSISLTATSNTTENVTYPAQGGEVVYTVDGYVGTNTAQTFSAEFVLGFAGNSNLFASLPDYGTFCANIDIGSTTPTLCNPFATASAAPEPSYIWFVAAGLLIASFLGTRKLAVKRG